MKADGIGARVTRKEDHRFLTGNGQYTDDITLPHQSYAAFVRSPHAHATINSIDSKSPLSSSEFRRSSMKPRIVSSITFSASRRLRLVAVGSFSIS